MRSDAQPESLQRHGPLARQLADILGVNADSGTRRAGAHTGRAAFQTRADITFHRGLGAFGGFDAPQALEQGDLRSLLRHLDDAVRTVFLAVPTADAGFINEDLTVGKPVNRRWRAITHAMRMLTVPAGCWQMQGL